MDEIEFLRTRSMEDLSRFTSAAAIQERDLRNHERLAAGVEFSAMTQQQRDRYFTKQTQSLIEAGDAKREQSATAAVDRALAVEQLIDDCVAACKVQLEAKYDAEIKALRGEVAALSAQLRSLTDDTPSRRHPPHVRRLGGR